MGDAKDIRDVIRRTYAKARELGACGRFTGEESSAGEIFDLFRSFQGMEFCLEHDFPDRDLMLEYKACGAADYGIYIDAGEITVNNPERAVFMGDTRATVVCDRLDKVGRKPSRVFLLQGAKAVILASNWAVCFVKAAPSCEIARIAEDHALIM